MKPNCVLENPSTKIKVRHHQVFELWIWNLVIRFDDIGPTFQKLLTFSNWNLFLMMVRSHNGLVRLVGNLFDLKPLLVNKNATESSPWSSVVVVEGTPMLANKNALNFLYRELVVFATNNVICAFKIGQFYPFIQRFRRGCEQPFTPVSPLAPKNQWIREPPKTRKNCLFCFGWWLTKKHEEWNIFI